MANRLDKILSTMGFGSRKQVKELVKNGCVTVDGEVVKDSSMHIDTDIQELHVNGEKIEYKEFVYIMMNKPRGVISATEDEFGHETVIDLLDDGYKGYNLSCAGRLDIDTEGLMIITNDGQLVHRIISPKKQVVKKYYCVLDYIITDKDINEFEKGIVLADAYKCLPARLEKISDKEAFVYITEGKFHQVKRMFYARRNNVRYLKRVQIGNLELDSKLEPGEYRELLAEEIKMIFE
ncbi:MAG TPA: pseudouridine synthase [Clostridia bacterium]|nr:rRNA pseudouridine synthase [Clostridiaceae bacterium]HOA32267.1 pseudouridine synthase [Clostridia bacterium]HPZ53400.1 pseudouridine synthase [Clostridia bacterium]